MVLLADREIALDDVLAELDQIRAGQLPVKGRKKFADAGFEAPNLVFWNVNARSAQFPMTKNDDGVCIVSGCSPAILKALLSGNSIDPIQVLYDAVNVERYDRVVVY